MKTVLVTGGAGFIGSNFCRYLMEKHPEYDITVLDALTYAGNLENLSDLMQDQRFSFVHGDIRDRSVVDDVLRHADAVVNFAAETHVDRSIADAGDFVTTDVYGVYVLLEACRTHGVERFIQISTDEVYGNKPEGASVESDPLKPSSPYSASKAGGEMLARSYFVTYGSPVIVTRGSNTFGPHQYPEKLVPLFITNAMQDLSLPVYGDGKQVRDWIYVEDHCEAIDIILHKGNPGEAYNIGGGYETTNLAVTKTILAELGKPESLIEFVGDRPGHDRRYFLDCTRIRNLGWAPRHDFSEALKLTIQWYVEHESWWRRIKEQQREYREFSKKWYEERSVTD